MESATQVPMTPTGHTVMATVAAATIIPQTPKPASVSSATVTVGFAEFTEFTAASGPPNAAEKACQHSMTW